VVIYGKLPVNTQLTGNLPGTHNTIWGSAYRLQSADENLCRWPSPKLPPFCACTCDSLCVWYM